MDKYMENRFGYLREKSYDELKELMQELSDEARSLFELSEDKKISSFERTDVYNDLRYAKEKLMFVEYLINEIESSKKR